MEMICCPILMQRIATTTTTTTAVAVQVPGNMLHQLCVIKVTRIRNGTAAAAAGVDEGGEAEEEWWLLTFTLSSGSSSSSRCSFAFSKYSSQFLWTAVSRVGPPVVRLGV